MSDLSQFLLARIAEDEGRYDRSRSEYGYGWKHMLVECEVKRRRVALLDKMEGDDVNVVSSYAYHLLCIEALPYAEHPDFREEWK